MINPMTLLKLKPMIEQFHERHPKFVGFLNAAPAYIGKDGYVEITITSPTGEVAKTSIRVAQEDTEMFDALGQLLGAEQKS